MRKVLQTVEASLKKKGIGVQHRFGAHKYFKPIGGVYLGTTVKNYMHTFYIRGLL